MQQLSSGNNSCRIWSKITSWARHVKTVETETSASRDWDVVIFAETRPRCWCVCRRDRDVETKTTSLEAWLSLVTEQQLVICTCSVIAEHAQIASCCSVTNDDHSLLLTTIIDNEFHKMCDIKMIRQTERLVDRQREICRQTERDSDRQTPAASWVEWQCQSLCHVVS